MSTFELEMSVFFIQIEISLFTPLMENRYFSRRFFTCSPVTNTNVTDGAIRPVIDDTKKSINDNQDFTSLSPYSQIRRYKHSHVLVTNKQI